MIFSTMRLEMEQLLFLSFSSSGVMGSAEGELHDDDSHSVLVELEVSVLIEVVVSALTGLKADVAAVTGEIQVVVVEVI